MVLQEEAEPCITLGTATTAGERLAELQGTLPVT